MYSPEEKDPQPNHAAAAAQNAPTFFARPSTPAKTNQEKLLSLALSAIRQNKVSLLEVVLQTRHKDLLHYYETVQLDKEKSKQNTLKTSLLLKVLTAFHTIRAGGLSYSQEELDTLEDSINREWMEHYKVSYEELATRTQMGVRLGVYVFEAMEHYKACYEDLETYVPARVQTTARQGVYVEGFNEGEDYAKESRPSKPVTKELDKLLEEIATLKTKALLEAKLASLQSKLAQCNEEEGAYAEQTQKLGLLLHEYQEKFPDLEVEEEGERAKKILALLEGPQGQSLLDLFGREAQSILQTSSLSAFEHYPSAQGGASLFQYPLSKEDPSAVWDFLLKRTTWMKQSIQQGRILSLQAIDEALCWRELSHLAQETGLWSEALWYEARAYLASGSITDKLAYKQMYSNPNMKEEDKQAFFAALIRRFFGVGRVLDLLEKQGFVDLKKSKELAEADRPLMAYVLGRDLKGLLELGIWSCEADQNRLAALLKEEHIPTGLKIEVIDGYLNYHKLTGLDAKSVLAKDLPFYLRQALSELLKGFAELEAVEKELLRLSSYKTGYIQALSALEGLSIPETTHRFYQALSVQRSMKESLGHGLTQEAIQVLEESLFHRKGMSPFRGLILALDRELGVPLSLQAGFSSNNEGQENKDESKDEECKEEERNSHARPVLLGGRERDLALSLSAQRLPSPLEPARQFCLVSHPKDEDSGFQALGVSREALVYELLKVLKEGRGQSSGLEAVLGAVARERLLSGELDEMARACDKLEKNIYLAEQLVHQHHEKGLAEWVNKEEQLTALATGNSEQKKEAGESLQLHEDEGALRKRIYAIAEQALERYSCTTVFLKAFIQFYLGGKGPLPLSLAVWYCEQHQLPYRWLREEDWAEKIEVLVPEGEKVPTHFFLVRAKGECYQRLSPEALRQASSYKERVRINQWKLGFILAVLDYVYAHVSGNCLEEGSPKVEKRLAYFLEGLQETDRKLPQDLLENEQVLLNKEFYFAANKPGVVCLKHFKLRDVLEAFLGRSLSQIRAYKRLNYPMYLCLQAAEALKGLLESSKDSQKYLEALDAERQSSDNLEWLQNSPWAWLWSLVIRNKENYAQFLDQAHAQIQDFEEGGVDFLPKGINTDTQFVILSRIQRRLRGLGLDAWRANLPLVGVTEEACQQVLRRPSMQQDLELIMNSQGSMDVLASLSLMRDGEAGHLIPRSLSQNQASKFYARFCEQVEKTITNPGRTKALLRSIESRMPGVSESKAKDRHLEKVMDKGINLHTEFLRLGGALEGREKIHPASQVEMLEQDNQERQNRRLPITQNLGFHLLDHYCGALSFIRPQDLDKFALFLLEMLLLYVREQEKLEQPWDLFDWLDTGPNLFIDGVLYEGPEIELIGIGKVRCMSLLRESGFQCVEVEAAAEAKDGEEESLFYYALRSDHLPKPAPEKYGFKNATPKQVEFLNQEILRLRALAPWYPKREPDGKLSQDLWLDDKIFDVLPDKVCTYKARIEKYNREEMQEQHAAGSPVQRGVAEREIKKLKEQGIADRVQIAQMAAERAADQAKMAEKWAKEKKTRAEDKELAVLEKEEEGMEGKNVSPAFSRSLQRLRETAEKAKKEAEEAQQESKEANQKLKKAQEAADEARSAFERQYPPERNRRGSQEFFSSAEGSRRKPSAENSKNEEHSEGHVPG